MKPPPASLDGARVLYYCSLGEPVQPTGTHAIVIDGERLFPANVAICQYENSSTIYRFYCDQNWEVLSDFDYLSAEEAIESVDSSYKGAARQFKILLPDS